MKIANICADCNAPECLAYATSCPAAHATPVHPRLANTRPNMSAILIAPKPNRTVRTINFEDDGQAFGRVLTGWLDLLAAAKNAEEEQ